MSEIELRDIELHWADRKTVGCCNACHDKDDSSVVVVLLRNTEVRLCRACMDRLVGLFKKMR